MKRCKKINSIHFGGAWIGISIFVGGILPFFIWIVTNRICWPFCLIGAISLIIFGVVFSIEMHQDNGKVPYYLKQLKESIPFDKDTQYAVIRSSICTGEKVAGFKNKVDGSFLEVMVIRNQDELELFKSIYDIIDIKTEY